MRAGALALGAVWLAAGLASCGGEQAVNRAAAPPPASTGAPAAAAPGGVTEAGVTLTLVRAQRTGRDIVQVDLLAANPAAAPVDLAAAFAREGGLTAAFLLAEDGHARVFVLTDGDGVPQCSTPSGGLAPGAQQPVFVRFPALSASAHTATLIVPGVGTVPGVQVPAAEGD